MSDLSSRILAAAQAGSLLPFLAEAREDLQELQGVLADVHNSGRIDVIAAYADAPALPNHAFFTVAHLLSKLLPSLQAPTAAVLHCVVAMARKRGSDLTADHDLVALKSFCQLDSTRVAEALEVVRQNPSRAIALPHVLLAGVHLNADVYLTHLLELVESPDIELRTYALQAAAEVSWPSEHPTVSALQAKLAAIADTETSTQVIAECARTIARLSERSTISQGVSNRLLPLLLRHTDPLLTHVCAQLLAFHVPCLSDDLLTTILTRLATVPSTNAGTLDVIDLAIAGMMRCGRLDFALQLLVALLTRHPDPIRLPAFDSTVATVSHDVPLRQATVGHLLGNGTVGACQDLTCLFAGDAATPLPTLSTSTMQPLTAPQTVLLARKIVGYLFTRPLIASSMLCSILANTEHADAAAETAQLLWNPMMLSYPGTVIPHLRSIASSLTGHAKAQVKRVLRTSDQYYTPLSSLSIPALRPSEDNRRLFQRHFQRLMAASMEQAERKSFLFHIMSKQIVLYSNHAVHYGPAELGRQRIETPLVAHRTSFEEARLLHIDPVGLDYMLRVFRVARLRS